MTYLADRGGLIYWALGRSLQAREDALRVVLSYVPIGDGGYRKCVFHGYDFEVERLERRCGTDVADGVVGRVTSLVQSDDVAGDQYLALPVRDVDEVFGPVRIEAAGEKELLDPDVLVALRERLDHLGVDAEDVRFYGRVACGLAPNGSPGDVDIVLDQLRYRTRVEGDAATREKITLDGLDPFFRDDPHRLATVKRRWSLSQLELDACGRTIQLDVKVTDEERPNDVARLYYDRSWGRLGEVIDLRLTVTDADRVLSPAPLLRGRTSDGTVVSVSSKHYMYSGMATVGDNIRVTGVADESGQRIALTNPVKHYVLVDLPRPDLFVG
jgi:hypothetical protein